jgi:hypothetical protein
MGNAMENNEYELALEKARLELSELLAAKNEIELRILRLTGTVESLRALCSNEPKSFQAEVRGLGLTDAIRRILESSNFAMSPTQVRAVLMASHFDLSEQSNPMASIHSVLKRLVEAGEVVPDPSDGRGTTYLWLTPLRRALLQEVEDRKRYIQQAFAGKRFKLDPTPAEKADNQISATEVLANLRCQTKSNKESK